LPVPCAAGVAVCCSSGAAGAVGGEGGEKRNAKGKALLIKNGETEPQSCGRSAASPRGSLCRKLSSSEWLIHKTKQTQLRAGCTLAGCSTLLCRWLTCTYVLCFQILLDVVPSLPDIPLPPIQANYRSLPPVQCIACSQTKREGTLGRKIGVNRAAATVCGREWERVLAGFRPFCWVCSASGARSLGFRTR